MVEKHPIRPGRVRRPPREGFSWVDRRFLREHAPGLSRDAIVVYLFYCAVADREGLSYWSDTAAAARLKLDAVSLERARDELVRRDLLAYGAPLVQVLALPEALAPRASRRGEAESLGSILRGIQGTAT